MPSILKPLATDTNRSEKNIQFTMQSNTMLLLVSTFSIKHSGRVLHSFYFHFSLVCWFPAALPYLGSSLPRNKQSNVTSASSDAAPPPLKYLSDVLSSTAVPSTSMNSVCTTGFAAKCLPNITKVAMN